MKAQENNFKRFKLKNLKCYFIILNLILSIIAFGGLASAPGGIRFEFSDSNPGTEKRVDDLTTTPVPSGTGNELPTEDSKEVGSGEEGGGDGSNDDDSSKDNEPGGDRPPVNVNGGGGGGGTNGVIGGFLNNQLIGNAIYYGGAGAGLFGIIGGLAGGDNGGQWGALAGAVGGIVTALAIHGGASQTDALILGLITAGLIFIFTYKKSNVEVTEFYCLPWQAPVGGNDCELCNKFEECSEYTCRSLGQACQIVNAGSEEQKCVWQNPQDVNSPIIKFKEVSKGYNFKPFNSVRPPSTGVIIKPDKGECVKAFFPLSFTFETNEPAQCKIDYVLKDDYEKMNFFVNGSNLFVYNHTEKLSLPGPEALNSENPELKNNGEYTLFIRCQDANGNFNQDAYSVNFCVEKGPDTTPPMISEVNIPSGNPVRFNQSSFDLEVYVNEPSECKWSRTDQNYDNMENKMNCDTKVFQMNNKNLYTCRTTLTGIQDRKNNDYYFRCKDQPQEKEGDRNVNVQSYPYRLIGTQPLNILEVKPEGIIKGSADVIPVNLEIKTDNGYENGNALCYYYNDKNNLPPKKDEDYVLFHDTKSSIHLQRQDLVKGDYVYYFKCVDLGGNVDYKSTSFKVETDRNAPNIVRVYRETELKIITDEKAECSYSYTDCNFEIESGIKMTSVDNYIHNSEWVLNKNYYIRCNDKYNNQPFPNTCSIIVRPSQFLEYKTDKDEWSFNF
ncbi:MAG: hypothetical protein AABW83_02950 [Nanoarchaeota archaeon]